MRLMSRLASSPQQVDFAGARSRRRGLARHHLMKMLPHSPDQAIETGPVKRFDQKIPLWFQVFQRKFQRQFRELERTVLVDALNTTWRPRNSRSRASTTA